MGGEGFEPSKALPSDLQSDPFDRSGNPPKKCFSNRTAGRTDSPHLSAAIAPKLQAVYGAKTKGFPYELAEGLEPTTC